MRNTISVGLAVGLAGLLATAVVAGNIAGTPKNDTLRGSAKADRIDGKAGNDKLYGLAGKDVLIGGAGNDLLVGGPAADTLNCGAGKDVAQADDLDKVSRSCEKVKGLSPPPQVSIADASVVEGNAGSASLSFSVTLSKAAKRPASVRYATADRSASAPGDYASASGTLNFAPGESSKTIAVAVVGDSAFEPDENVTVALSGAVNATIARGSASGTITNDDPAYRSGRYAGTTSQGRPISFDVAADGKSVVNLTFGYELNCTEAQGFTLSGTVTIDVPTAINPDGSFVINHRYSETGYRESIDLEGRLTTSGATGSFRAAFEIDDIAGIPTLHCQTGDTPATWSAS